MQGGFYLTLAFRTSFFGQGIVGTINLLHLAIGIFFTTCTLHDISIFQPYFLSRRQSIELFRCFFHKVIPFNIQFTGKGNCATARAFVFGIIDGFVPFHFPFGVIGNNKLYGIQYGTYPGSNLVEMFAYGKFQQALIYHSVKFRITYPVYKISYGFGRIAAPAQTAKSRHAWIVPTFDKTPFDQLQQFSLTHYGVGYVQAIEFNLPGPVIALL